jgi:hypothetical protein
MSDLNILPADQNRYRAAGFESSSTTGLVMAGQIDEITGRILVDNAGTTTITVANEATDTTCFPIFVTAATGSLEPKSNAGLTFNSNTSILNATILASSSLTASEIVITDASKNLVSGAVATYPSLTELTYLKGVTSAIQTQFTAKAPLVSPSFTTPALGVATATSLALNGGTLSHTISGATVLSTLEVHSEGVDDIGALTVHRHTDTAAFGADYIGLRSNGTHASPTIVANNDQVVKFLGAGYDGTDYAILAEVRFEVDGTPGNNDMPGRIVFLTTPDGSQTPVEAMRLSNTKAATFASTVTATSYNGLTITTTTGVVTITNAKTLAVTNTLTLSGTDSTIMTFPTTSATIARTDAAQTFTGLQTYTNAVNYTNNAITASGNSATVPITARIHTVTNNSAATLTITLTTTSAVDGQLHLIRVLDFSAAAQTITWVNTENSTVTAPVTSNGSTTLPLTIGFQYNSATSKWRCIASS